MTKWGSEEWHEYFEEGQMNFGFDEDGSMAVVAKINDEIYEWTVSSELALEMARKIIAAHNSGEGKNVGTKPTEH